MPLNRSCPRARRHSRPPTIPWNKPSCVCGGKKATGKLLSGRPMTLPIPAPIAAIPAINRAQGGPDKPGRHIRVKKETPLTNLYLGMLDRVGVPTEKLGDSTGKLESLS